MNVFVKYFAFILCVGCAFSLNKDGSTIQAKSPESSDKKTPWLGREARDIKLDSRISHNDSPVIEQPAQDLTAEKVVKISSEKSLEFEKPVLQRRLIRATDSKRKSISTIEMTVSMEPDSEQNREAKFLGEDYVVFKNANGSLKLHRTPATFSEARLTCYDEGAELASPDNGALLEAMSTVLLTSRQPPLHIFTGVNDLYSKGYFTSLRGTQLSAMPAQWSSREPNNVSHFGNCLIMQSDGLLLDSKCDDVYPYICYKRQKLNQNDLCGTDTEYVFNKLTKSCYKIHPRFVSWQEAYASCAREGSYLAIVNSEYEAKALADMIKREWIWAHIGFSYWRKDLWMTIHGESLSEAGFDYWVPGEPNDYMEERCGCLAADMPALVDIDCLDHARPFICEKPSLLLVKV